MNGEKQQIRIMREITPEWERLIRVAAALDFGEAKVVFNNGKPVRIDSAVKQIKLTSDEEFNEGLKTIPLL